MVAPMSVSPKRGTALCRVLSEGLWPGADRAKTCPRSLGGWGTLARWRYRPTSWHRDRYRIHEERWVSADGWTAGVHATPSRAGRRTTPRLAGWCEIPPDETPEVRWRQPERLSTLSVSIKDAALLRSTRTPGSKDLSDRSLQDSQCGAQGRLGHDREALLEVAAHLRPVVVGRHIGNPTFTGIQAVTVEVRNRNIGPEIPRDLLVALEEDEVHGHVVLAQRDVIKRLAVHVDDERVAHLLGGLAS